MKDLLAALAIILATFTLWGIGACALRLSCRKNGSLPVPLGVGLALLLFVGGVLNALHIAYGPGLWAVAGAGIIVSCFEIRCARFTPKLDRAARLEFLTAALVIAAVTGFAIHTQLPPRVFNAADDFQKYLAHPVGMLETGTLLGSPLGGLGSQTFGGQAFLQGFVLSVLPISYVNGVDAVFGQFLLMLMAAAVGWRRYGRFPGALLGPLLIAAINPQYVNVSSLYLGAVLMATAVLLVCEEHDNAPPSPLILGLVYAALVAMKLSFAPFVVLHLGLSAFAVNRQTGSAKSTIFWATRVAVMSALCIAPWLAVHLPNYLATGTLGGVDSPTGDDGELNLFSAKDLYYGASFAHYTFIAALTAITAICALIAAMSDRERRCGRLPLGIAAAAGTCALSYVAFCYILGPRWSGYVSSLRYCIPTIIGSGVFAIILFPALPLRLPRIIATGAPAMACLGVVIAFIPSMTARYQQAVASGSILAFSTMAEFPTYIRYSDYCLSPEAARRIQSLQSQVPPGQPLLAWVGTAFLLDYARNPITNPESGGLVTPWARVPGDVHYVLWQYRDLPGFEGFGVTGVNDYQEKMHGAGRQDRMIAARELAFLQQLQQLSARSKMLANDGQFALFQLPDDAPQPKK